MLRLSPLLALSARWLTLRRTPLPAVSSAIILLLALGLFRAVLRHPAHVRPLAVLFRVLDDVRGEGQLNDLAFRISGSHLGWATWLALWLILRLSGRPA